MRTKRPGIVIALFSLVVTIWATSAIFDLIRREVQSATAKALDAAQSIVLRTTGLELKYDYLSFDSINSLSAHNVRLYRPDTTARGAGEATPEPGNGALERANVDSVAGGDSGRTPVATIGKLALRLSYWALLSGQNSEALRDVAAQQCALALSLPDDQATIDKIIDTLSKPGGPTPRFQLSIAPLMISLADRTSVQAGSPLSEKAPNASIFIEELQLSTLTGAPEIRVPSISLESGGAFGLPADLSAKLGVQGSGSADFSSLNFTVSASARAPGWLLMPQRLSIRKTGNRVEVTREGNGLSLAGWYEGGAWHVEGTLAGYRGGKDVTVGGVLGELLGGVAVSGTVRADGVGAKLGSYAVNLRTAADSGVKIEGVDIGNAIASLKGSGDELKYVGSIGASLNGYEFGYSGEMTYSGLGLMGNFVARGNGFEATGGVRGSQGSYKLSIVKGAYGDFSISGKGYAVGLTYSKSALGLRVGEKLVGSVTLGGEVRGEVKLAGFGVGVGKGVVWLDGEVMGWYGKGGYGAQVRDLGVRYEGEGEYPSVVVSGEAGATGATLTLESAKYNGKEFKGTLSAEYESPLNALQKSNAQFSLVSVENERAKIQGEITAANGNIEASIGAASLPIEQIVPSSWKMIGDIQIQGKANILVHMNEKLGLSNISLADLQITTQKTEIGGIPFTATAGLHYKNNSISIDSGNFTYQNYKIENMQAQYDLSSKKLQYSMNAKAVLVNQLISSTISGLGSIDGTLSDILAKANAQFTGDFKDIKFNASSVDPISYTVNLRGSSAALDLGQSGNARAHATLTDMRDFEITVNNLFNINGSAKGSIHANNLNADATLDNMDLNALQLFISPRDIKDISGTMSGSLTMSGDIADPKINGKIQLAKAAFSSNVYLLEKAGPFNAEIDIKDGAVELSPTIIKIGAGDVSVAATANLARWELGDITAFVSTQQTAALQFKGTIAGLTASNIQVKADMKANISQGKFELGGNVFLDNGTLEVNPEGFAAQDKPTQPTLPLSLNLAVTLGKNVELYLPSQDIPLVRGMSSPNSALNILYDEASGGFSVNGKIELRSGYVLYLLRNFFIKQCTIDFAENQTKFNPLISATAELRELSRDGMINITLAADRSPFENFKPRLSSVPPKSETELLALLGGGLALLEPSSTTPLTIREAVIAGSEFLTQNSIFRSFEQRVQKTLGLDALYIQSSFIQRWLLDITDPTHTGHTPLSAYLTGTELFAGKYITDSAFAHFTLSMAQNPLEETGALQLDSELGLELQSPFGLLQWGLSFGKQGTPLNNQTISLSWRINY